MSNWGLSKKIWSVLGLLVVAFIGSTYLALTRMGEIRDALNEITLVFVKRDQLTSEIQDGQRQMTIAALEIILQTEAKGIAAAKKRYDEMFEKQKETVANYQAIASEKGKELAGLYFADFSKWDLAARKSRELAEVNKNIEAFKVLEDSSEFRANMRRYNAEMNKLTADSLASKTAEANALATSAIFMALVISVVSILVSMIVAYFVLRSATNAINEVVRNLHDSSAQVTSASTQIASSSEELSQATTEQAAALEQTAASIEEMNSMVAKNSENASNTAQTSSESQSKATQGKSVVEKMIKSMDAINESNDTIMTQINHSNNQFAEIAKVIEEIGTKTKVINDIVFQTRLLSFNASVEAARAGEHGKGFAVVAEEVGNLAQMSGNAAKEISSMLEGSIRRVHTIVEETKASVAKLVAEGKTTVEEGARVAQQCGEVLDEIVNNVGSVSNMATEIAQASQEQSRGVAEITKAMNQLDTVTQQNAATSEEAASAAVELSAQAEAMKNAVGHLVAVIQGGGHGASQGADSASWTQKKEPKRASPSPKGDAGKVVQLKTQALGKPNESEGERYKMAAGDSVAPSYDDKRFKDI